MLEDISFLRLVSNLDIASEILFHMGTFCEPSRLAAELRTDLKFANRFAINIEISKSRLCDNRREVSCGKNCVFTHFSLPNWSHQ